MHHTHSLTHAKTTNNFENEVLPGTQVPRLVISERLQSLSQPKKSRVVSSRTRRGARPEQILQSDRGLPTVPPAALASVDATPPDQGDRKLAQRLAAKSVKNWQSPHNAGDTMAKIGLQDETLSTNTRSGAGRTSSVVSDSTLRNKKNDRKLIAVSDTEKALTKNDLSDTERNIPLLNMIHPKCFLRESELVVLPRAITTIKYYTDQGFRPLLCAFRNMAWKDFRNRGKWHMFWANVANARALFQPGQRHYFNDDQLVNHYATCYHLSRKDNMTKNIKKYRLEMHQARNPIAAKDRHGNFLYLDLIAPTYLLPFDWKNFVQEFRKHGGLWIVKPCSSSQGQGISLINQMDHAKRFQERAAAEVAASVQDNESYQGFLISRYLANPLLIDGKKFDLRLYVLVTSFKPLRCYYYRQGFCRFCGTKYSSDVANMEDKFMHLTNVAVQKQKKGYNRVHGNKWSIKAFRMFLERLYGRGKIDELFDRIFWMIVQSLKSVQPLMDNDRHCYEMYGYDCLIDVLLKPWLLEINASPSLEDSTPLDRVIKTNLLTDTMKMAMYERCPHLLGIWEKKQDGSDMPLGDYEILCIEEPAPRISPSARKVKKAMGRYGPAYGLALVPTQSGVKEKPRWNSF